MKGAAAQCSGYIISHAHASERLFDMYFLFVETFDFTWFLNFSIEKNHDGWVAHVNYVAQVLLLLRFNI